MKADDIRIPEPCHEDWGRMTPKQRGRFCGACQKKVHDLSAMSQSDAKRILDSGGDICVSYLSDHAGVVQFQPERIVPVGRLFRRASATAAAGLSIALAACAPHGDGPSLDDADIEQPAFLEVTPSIPDAEPCDSTPPGSQHDLVRTLGEPMPSVEPVIRTKGGDFSDPEGVSKKHRKKGKIRRTGGKPVMPRHGSPRSGL